MSIFPLSFQDIFEDLAQIYQDKTGVTLERQDAERLMVNIFATGIFGWGSAWLSASAQNFLANMTQSQLDDYGVFFGVERLDSTPATSVVRFQFTDTLEAATFIYENTVVVGSNDNGSFNFKVTQDIYLESGIDYIDITVEEYTTSGNSGADANDIEIGDIDTLDESEQSYSFVDSVANVVESSGGQVSETDDAYRERLVQATDEFSTAGTYEAYKYKSRKADVAIIDVGVIKQDYDINLYVLPKNFDDSLNINLIGDGAGQLDNLVLTGLTLSNTDSGKLYWNLTDTAGTRTFSIYKDDAKTSLVAQYSGIDGIGVTITQQAASGISGTVDLAWTEDDTDTTNEILSSMQQVAALQEMMYPSSGHSQVRPLNDVVNVALVSGVAVTISSVALEITTTNIDTVRGKALQIIDIFMDGLKNKVGTDVIKSQLSGDLAQIAGVRKVTVEFNSTPATVEIAIADSDVALVTFSSSNLDVEVV